MGTPGTNGNQPAIPKELESFVANHEIRMNAIIARLLAVNDIYGHKVIRQAILDELNQEMRKTRECLQQPSSISKPELLRSATPI